jgi:hypothetical protein
MRDMAESSGEEAATGARARASDVFISYASPDRAVADDVRQAALRGISLLQLGEFESARQSCDTPPLDWESRLCLAIAYDKLPRRPDAEAQVRDMKADLGDSSAYQFAEIYAQWGDIPKALDWLETAYHLKDPGLVSLKSDEFFGPLRNEPRFREIERQVNIPN